MKVAAGGADTTNLPYSVSFNSGAYTDSAMSVRLSSSGKIRLKVTTASAKIHVRVDVQGYFSGDAGEGSGFTPLGQERMYDSRTTTAIPAGGTRVIPATGEAGIPWDGSSAVALTVLALNWSASGSVALYNPEDGPSNTLSVSFKAGGASTVGASSTNIVAPSDGRVIAIKKTSSAPVEVLLTTQGYFTERFDEVAEAAEFDSETACLDAPLPEDRCLIASYETTDEVDPLDTTDLTVAAVAQTIEAGDQAKAEEFVETRADHYQDSIQSTIEGLVQNGVPETPVDEDEEPASTAYHPNSVRPATSQTGNSRRNVTVKYKKWRKTKAGDCSCNPSGKVFQKVRTWWVADNQLYKTYGVRAGFDVKKGKRVCSKAGRCRLRHEFTLQPDITTHNFSNCGGLDNANATKSDETSYQQWEASLPNGKYHRQTAETAPGGPAQRPPRHIPCAVPHRRHPSTRHWGRRRGTRRRLPAPLTSFSQADRSSVSGDVWLQGGLFLVAYGVAADRGRCLSHDPRYRSTRGSSGVSTSRGAELVEATTGRTRRLYRIDSSGLEFVRD